jgi:hypothetical protein
MRLFFLLFLLISFKGYSQCKTYTRSANGDVINCTDKNDLKQGKWVIRKEGLRGEPGYEEEGIYIDGKKEGVWRLYTKMGDLFAVERYRWGHKDGLNQYFDIAGLVREESWKAVNPANPYDTVDVYDPVNPNKIYMKVVKIEGTSVKHGKWKYYDSQTGRIVKSESWFLDKIEDPNAFAVLNSQLADTTTKKPVAKVKPKEVAEFEKKLGKKGKKVIDARTGY